MRFFILACLEGLLTACVNVPGVSRDDTYRIICEGVCNNFSEGGDFLNKGIMWSEQGNYSLQINAIPMIFPASCLNEQVLSPTIFTLHLYEDYLDVVYSSREEGTPCRNRYNVYESDAKVELIFKVNESEGVSGRTEHKIALFVNNEGNLIIRRESSFSGRFFLAPPEKRVSVNYFVFNKRRAQ